MYSAEAATSRALEKLRQQLFERAIDAGKLRHAFAEADLSGS
jgi:hypothetical protein